MVDEYRKITAEICDVSLTGWEPDRNPTQRDMIQDVIYDWGVGIKTLEPKGIVGGFISVKIFRGGESFIGDAPDREMAFMKAFMQWYQS